MAGAGFSTFAPDQPPRVLTSGDSASTPSPATSDPPEPAYCTTIGGSWDGVSVCTFSGSYTVSGALEITSGTTLVITNSGSETYGISIYSGATLAVDSGGAIIVTSGNAGYGGILVNQGTFTNSGTITTENSAAGSDGIENYYGAFTSSGTITIENAGMEAYGINNFYGGAFTSSGTITIETSGTDTDGIVNYATFTNSGTVTVENSAGFGVWNNGGAIVNECDATITVENTGGTGINNEGGTITNDGGSIIGYAGAVTEGPGCTTTYSATFQQSGIPTSGVTWGITVGTSDYTGTGASIVVPGLSGTVSYAYDSPVAGTSGTRHVCPTGCSGSLSGATTAMGVYETQYMVTFGYTSNDGSTIPLGVNIGYYEQFGSLAHTIISGSSYGVTSPTSDWVDANGYVVYETYAAGTGTERWSPSSEGGYQYQIGSSGTFALLFYHQFETTFGYTTNDGSTITSGALIGSYSQFGSSIGIFSGASYGTTSPSSDWVNTGAAEVSYYGCVYACGNERWVVPGTGTVGYEVYDFGVGASGAIISPALYDQFMVTFGYTDQDSSAITPGDGIGYYDQFGSQLIIRSGASYGTTSLASDWVDAGTGTLLYFSPSPTATERWALPPPFTNTFQGFDVTLSSTIETEFYHQFLVTFGYTTNDGSTITSGVNIGYYEQFDSLAHTFSSGSSYGTTSPSSDWVDAGGYVVYETYAATGGTERWSPSALGGYQYLISSSSSLLQLFYHQYELTLSYSTSDGTAIFGSPKVTFTASQFGSATGTTLTTSVTTAWYDASSSSTAYAVTPTTVPGGSGDVYQLAAGANQGSITSAATDNFQYFHTFPGVPVAITLNAAPGTNSLIGATNFFTVTYTSGGATKTADQAGGTLDLQVDPSTTVTVSAMSSETGANEQWCLYLCSADTFSSGTAGASETLVYYQQFLEQVSYSTSGGAPPSDWCPVAPCNQNFFYSGAGLPLSVPLTTTATAVLMDVGSTWSVVDPAFGSTASEGWFAIPSTSSITTGPATASDVEISGTVSTLGSIALVFYHEYSVQAGYSTSNGKTILLSDGDAATITLGGTQSGAPAQITLFPSAEPSWLDAGSSWTVTPSTVPISSTEQYSLVSGGSGSVSGPGLKVDPFYQDQYLVTFAFSGTPIAGESILVNGVTIIPGNMWENAGAILSISLTSQAGFSKWESTSSISLGDASSASTTATINGTGTVTALLNSLYPVTFEEEGLAVGTSWSVTLNGGTTTSSNPTISIFEPNEATYQYTIPCFEELCPVVASGQVTLDVGGSAGLPVVNVQFLGPWPSYLRDSQQTGTSPYVAAQAATLEWAFLAGDALDNSGQVCPPPSGFSEQCNGASEVSSPAIGPDGTIYFGDAGGSGPTLGTTNLYAGNLFALNPDGSLKWVYDTQGFIDGAAPAVGPDGTIYIEAQGNPGQSSILAINPDGTLKWQIGLAPNLDGVGQLSIEIAPSGETIYVAAGTILYALSPNGFVEWQDSLGATRLYSSPVLGPTGTIYIVGSSAKYGLTLYAVNPDGTVAWDVADSLAGGSLGGPAIGPDGAVYAGCASSICAYNPDSTLKWMVPIPISPGLCQFYGEIPADTPCTISAGPATTLVMGPGGTLLAVTQSSSSATSGTTTVVSAGWNTLYAFNSADGSVEWSKTPGSQEGNAHPPAIGADGTIYINCDAVNVCAFSSAGTELWEYDAQNAVGSLGPTDVQGSFGTNTAPAIGADGTVYFGDIYGHLFAVGPGPTRTLPIISKLAFELHSPINILITLPSGEQAGFDADGTLVNTAGATVIAPDPTTGQLETIDFNNPVGGQYELQIFGTGSGPFTVTAQSLDVDGNVLGSTSYTGTATEGSEQTTYLGLVGGGQMSMLLNAGLSNSVMTLGCAPVTMQAGGTATCTAALSGVSGPVTGENIGFSSAGGSGSIDLPSPASCTITSGDSCSVVVTGTGTGTVTVKASYAGDASNSASSATLTLAITSAPTSTGVACSPSPVSVGSPSKCTATVSGAYGSTIGETVSFTASGSGSFSSGGACTLSGGSCSVTYTPTSASGSPQTITATYPGDANDAGSSGSTTVTVNKVTTTTRIGCDSTTAFLGATTHCEAVVAAAGGAPLTGSVAFTSSDPHGTFGKVTCDTLANNHDNSRGSGGSLTCTVDYSSSSAGTQTLTATYSGDAYHSPSGATLQLTVTLILTSTSLECDPSTGDAAKAIRCEADVVSQDDSLPTGTVTFTSNDAHGTFGKVTCSVDRSDNEGHSNVLICQVDYTPSASGAHATITATYPGDASHSSSNATFRLNQDRRR